MAMADALLSSIVSTILGNLNSLVLEQLGLKTQIGLKTQLESLESTLSTIHAVLLDAEEKQWKNEALKNWLIKLKDAAYDADDLVDEFAMELHRQKGFRNQVRSFFSAHNPFIFRVRMMVKLKNVRERLDAIASERNKFHLKESVERVEVDCLDWRQTSSLVNELEIYGREKEKEELIYNLVRNDDGGLCVYAICGMGGIGKTTLAQLVYNDESVKMHFEYRMWVCVSVDFDLRRLTRAILESIEDSPCDLQELDPLQQRLQKKLSGRRFLLVLDDVWDYHHDKWNRLHDAVRVGAKGSVVVTTTRIDTVALKMATVPVFHVRLLSDDDSWSLFERRAFGNDGRDRHEHLETIGRAIVKKCGGIPLAIQSLGSLMRLKKTESEWSSVKESEIWDLPDEGSNILPALRLSYDHLPLYLRQCFAFCSTVPKDFVIKKERLIQLWMANGFVSSKGQRDLHETAQEIFSELVWRSFFEVVEEDKSGIMTCKMHDLIHDLAKSVATNECHFVLPNEALEVPKNVRHLAVYEGFEKTAAWNKRFFRGLRLRSFLMENEWDYTGFHRLAKQKSLRAISCKVQKLPMSLGKLKHLRYLDVSHSCIKTVPESICDLQNLQTLNMSYCCKLRALPNGIKHMKSLLYIDITDCTSLHCMPSGIGQLTSLRKLTMFIVGKDVGNHIGELKGLKLEGELSIKDLQNVKNLTDAESANLKFKKTLLSLGLSWQKYDSNNQSGNNEEILCGLQPHSSLKKLTISEYKGSKFPDWIMNMLLPNLVEISLQYCDRCEHLPPFGELPFLKNLSLIGMGAVRFIDSDLYGKGEISFPSLERLIIDSMSSLEEWKTMGERRSFARLWKLTVSNCRNLVELPVIPSVKSLGIGASSIMFLETVMHFTSLTSLWIFNFPELTLLPDRLLHNHTFLKHLKIADMKSLKSLSGQLDNLSSLKCLEISCCDELGSLPDGLQNLKSLETLSILWCDGLYSLPIIGFSGLSSLRNLSIEYCDKLGSLSEGMQYLTALEDLVVIGCPELNSLPNSIQHLAALRSLMIIYCEGLTSFPNQMQYLTSLSRLDIKFCPNLMSLPEGLQCLTAVRKLIIEECRYLEKRCKKGGKDWPKIAHIPSILINDKQIQPLVS